MEINGLDDASSTPLDTSIVGWNRRFAVEEIETIKLIRTTSWEQHSHSFKWLTASLLALNGGGLLGIGQVSGVRIDERLYSGSAFTLGLAFALLVAVFGQRSIAGCLAPLQKQISYWVTVSLDGKRDEGFENEIENELKRPMLVARFSQVAGWLSALAFFGAVLIAGIGMLEHSRSMGGRADQFSAAETEEK